MIKFMSDDIWPTIKRLSKKSRKSKVAVAYFGTGGARQLQLKKGDTLLIAMTVKNVKAGQVNPFEVEKLFRKGVNIYNLQNLHSKIFLFGNQAIIVSTNVSFNSQRNLVETAVLTNDRGIVQGANEFILHYCKEKVELDYIKLCKKKYNPPKDFVISGTTASKKFKGKLSSLWVIETFDGDFSEDDVLLLKKTEPSFKRKLKDKQKNKIIDIEYSINSKFIKKVKTGDNLIELYNNGKQVKVFKPKRALGVTINRKTGNSFLRLQANKRESSKHWNDFAKYLSYYKISNIKEHSTRKIIDENCKAILLDYFG